MSSGKRFSDREKAYINAHQKGLFASKIAETLGVLFPDDNGGTRDRESVQRYIRGLKKQ